MSSTRTWIFLSAVLSAGTLSLLPIEAAHAQKGEGEGEGEGIAIDVTQESATVNTQTGEVTISGTVTCSGAADAYINVSLMQPIGREKGVEGFSYGLVQCGPDGEPYTLSLFAYRGRFGPGRAVLTLNASACDWYTCDSANSQQSVKLTPGR
jgi:hypothetical protein